MLDQETRTLNELTVALLLSEIIIYLFSLWRTPLPSHLMFLKVHAHGKFLHRVSREGLGTSEM